MSTLQAIFALTALLIVCETLAEIFGGSQGNDE